MMSNTFNGFSEDDIRKVQNELVPKKPSGNEPKKSSLKTIKKATTKTNTDRTKKVVFSKPLSVDSASIPDDAKLAKPVIIEQEIAEQKIVDAPCKVSPEKKFVDLQEFEARRKFIEEQNKKRKELLVKALADRTKRTQEEAFRLNEIRNEFKQLDALLSNDVNILRQEIEAASVEYMIAQKRYDKVEKEFLEAKLSLQQKLERKELLTEHLCAIIEQNEERKAKKLTELLEKLDGRHSNNNQTTGATQNAEIDSAGAVELPDHAVEIIQK